jgi:hypothetical protein
MACRWLPSACRGIGLARGVKATLPGGERTYVCERQADAVAALLADFFTHCGT